MSQDVVKFSTVGPSHAMSCLECRRCRHPPSIHIPELTVKITRLRQKRFTADLKVQEMTMAVGDLEAKVRTYSALGRVDLKKQVLNRLGIYAGLLHMLLRYTILLKQDLRKLHSMIAHAHQSSDLFYSASISADEVEMIMRAPDIASFITYDFYPAPRVTYPRTRDNTRPWRISDSRDSMDSRDSRDSRDNMDMIADEVDYVEDEAYSIITDLFAPLTVR